MRTKTKKDVELQDLKEEPGHGNLTDSDLEELFFEEAAPKPGGAVNLPTIAGVGLIGMVFLYILQQVGFLPGNGLQEAFIVFPLVGILLVLLFGLIPRKQKVRRKRKVRATKKKRERKQKKKKERSTNENTKATTPPQSLTSKWNLPAKSRDKWLAGVCAGLASHINVDVTVLRLIFILSTVFTAGSIPPIVYLVLAILMRPPDDAEKPDTGSQK